MATWLEKVRDLLRDNGAMRQMSKDTGIPYRTLQNWKGGVRYPGNESDAQNRIVGAYGFSRAWFVDPTTTMPPRFDDTSKAPKFGALFVAPDYGPIFECLADERLRLLLNEYAKALLRPPARRARQPK